MTRYEWIIVASLLLNGIFQLGLVLHRWLMGNSGSAGKQDEQLKAQAAEVAQLRLDLEHESTRMSREWSRIQTGVGQLQLDMREVQTFLGINGRGQGRPPWQGV